MRTLPFKASVTLEVGEEEENLLGLLGFLSVYLSVCLLTFFFLAHLSLPFKTECDWVLYLHSQALLS